MADEVKKYNMSLPVAEIDEILIKAKTGTLAVVNLGENILIAGETVVLPSDIDAALTTAVAAGMPFLLKFTANMDGLQIPLSTVATIATLGEDSTVASSFGPYGFILNRGDGGWNFEMVNYMENSGALEEAAAELEGIVNGEY